MINDRNWSVTDTVTIPTVEYIDKTQALERICYDCNDWSCTKKWPCADYAAIRDISAADVKPVVKGEWIREETVESGETWVKWRCDECGYVRKQGWKHTKDGEKPQANICENCGADMRGKNDVGDQA